MPNRAYTGRPFPVLLKSVVLCDKHRPTLPDLFLTGELWEEVLRIFDLHGWSRPHRASTRVDYEPILSAEEIQ